MTYDENTRKVMEQAQEALESCWSIGLTDKNWKLVETSIVALRSALENPCGYDETTGNCTNNPCCSAALEQPHQEPVAHLWQHSETGRTRIVMPDQIITADANWLVIGPLYLHPARLLQAIEHYEAALKAAFPEGAKGKVYEHWNEARCAQEKNT